MKSIIISFMISVCSFYYNGYGQDLNVHNYINKNKSEVVKKYGKPVHQDNSNPAMICMFYKSNSGTMIFVSDQEGIFQSESVCFYEKEKEARSSLDAFIQESKSNQFDIDSVTISDFRLSKPGVKVELQLDENKLTKKFEVKVKANRFSY